MSTATITVTHPDRIDITQVDGCRFRLEWVELGEGWDGDYDPEDPKDTELLRLDLSEFDTERDEFECLPDGSFCTALPIADPNRARILRDLADLVVDHLGNGSVKRFMEAASWVSPSSGKNADGDYVGIA